jgi:alpha-glucan, water dikinase
MAVLIQKIVRAKYAFVIHTTNPTNGEDSEVYVEACRGLGESLVSDKPGQAFSFTTKKNDATGTGTVNSYPNKPLELVTGNGFMFRSDSNSEDLPGFAGAGLFDSYAMEDE